MCLSACSVWASGRGGTRGGASGVVRATRWSRSSCESGSESRRNARRKALRFTADSNASIEGVNHAPRPGSEAVSSTTRRPSRTTILTSEDRGARVRVPMHVLTGSTLPPRVAGRETPGANGVVPPSPGVEVDDVPQSSSRIESGWTGRACHRAADAARRRPGARTDLQLSRPRGSSRAGCRSARPSASRRGGRSGPPCRWRATAGSRARGRGRPWSTCR